MVVEHTKVQAAYTRARELGADHESACATVAHVLGIAIEAVREVAASNQKE